MINPFTRIEDNSRWLLNGKTIVVQESNLKGVSYYYLNDWWKIQASRPILFYMSRFEFILNVKKIN